MSFDYYRSEAQPEAKLREWAEFVGIRDDANFELWLNLRDKCRKDLFFLGKDVLKRDLLPKPHQEVCDFFVHKNFDGAYHEGYTLIEVHHHIDRQDKTHERILLYPRGSYKSTIDGVDIVQWLLNVPDIRILILTGEVSLGDAFLLEIKRYFFQAKDAPLTDFQKIFPEYILRGEVGTNSSPFVSPARQHDQVSPSVWQNSVTASLSGWHCDLIKGDDVVTDRNSSAMQTRANINMKYDATFYLLDEWGYAESVGTRYAVDDWYGERLRMKEDEAPIKVLCRPAWKPKPSFELVPLKELRESMVDLLFPEKLTFASLRKKLLKNEALFRSQQLNEPSMGGMAPFDPVVLREHVIEQHELPADGEIFIAWDWATHTGAKSDFSAGAIGKIIEDKLYVLEIIHGRWSPSDLAYQIVNSARRFNPRVMFVEDSTGAEFLKAEIRRTAYKLRYELPSMSWRMERGLGAKENRIQSLQAMLNSDRLYFVNGPWLDDAFLMFERWVGGATNRGRKDDIPDAVSMLQYFLPKPKKPDEPQVVKDPEQLMRELWEQQISAVDQKRYFDVVFQRHPEKSANDDKPRGPRFTLSRRPRSWVQPGAFR